MSVSLISDVVCSIFGAAADFAIAANSSYRGCVPTNPVPPDSSGADIRSLRQAIRELEAKQDQMALACMAMWSLMKDRGVTDEQLIQRIQEIDLLDGKLDGKVAPSEKIVKCPQCGRAMSRRHNRCMYCGNVNLGSNPLNPPA